MHAEDEADDQRIADQLKTQIITRSQSQAAERAQNNALIPSDTRQQARVKPSLKKGAKAVLVPKPLSASTDCLDILMSEMQGLSLAHAFVTHKIPFALPVHYNPAGMPTPKGEVVVVAVKAQKQTSDKATVRVEFLSPPSHAGKQIQPYPKSLEPKNGPAKEADFSLLTAVKALSRTPPRGAIWEWKPFRIHRLLCLLLQLWQLILGVNALLLSYWPTEEWKLLNVALHIYILSLRGRRMNLQIPPRVHAGYARAQISRSNASLQPYQERMDHS
jgi:hypothetical protein